MRLQGKSGNKWIIFFDCHPVRFPKELAHQIEPLAALAHEIGKPVRVRGLAIIRTNQVLLSAPQFVAKFLADQCEVGAEYRVRTRDLYAAYAEYCAKHERSPMTPFALAREITLLGFEYRECSSPKYYSYRRGLRLKPANVKEEKNDGFY